MQHLTADDQRSVRGDSAAARVTSDRVLPSLQQGFRLEAVRQIDPQLPSTPT
jgi:hypothetical protein